MRIKRDVTGEGELRDEGTAKVELLKKRMRDHKLYLLAVSEVRRDGSGSEDAGDGYTLVWNGAGPNGGVGSLLSPAAIRA